ncbi:MAG: FtsX-like permease family protein [Planctomycetaceae bacterium]
MPALATALVRAWRPQLLALAAAAGVVAATITGALGVGSALRRGLRDVALERLGGIEAAVVTDDFFRADLAAELAADLDGEAGPLVPAIVVEATVETASGTSARGSARATLLACDDPAALGFAGVAAPDHLRVHVNAPLFAALGTGSGAEVVVRVPPRAAVPADSPLGRRGGLASGSRERVAAVLPDAGLGRFSLVPAAATRPLVVTRLDAPWPLIRRGGVANVIFAARRADASGGDVASTIRQRLKPRLADLGLAFHPVADDRALRLTSRRLILPPEVDRAAAEILGPLGGRPTLAFLATALVPLADGEAATAGAAGNPVEIPYSTVLGIDTTALPGGDLVDDDGRPLAVPADDEIVIDRWMADDLAAQGRPVAVGDRLEVRFFLPETAHGKVEEGTAGFRIAGIAAMRGAAVDRDLVPEVEGVTDERSIADWDPPFPFDRSRIRATPPHDEDERYWQEHRATPKAFVSLAAARRLAASRFGATTAWFVPAAAGDRDALADRIAAAIDPAAVGIRVVPLRAEALAAARGSTPFGGLFLALSSFVVAAGLLLEWLLFDLLVAARRRDVGILAAVGWAPTRIARLLLAVGGIAAVGGVAIGTALGPAWSRALMAGLATAWDGAVEPGAAAAFARWPAAADVWPGGVVAAVVSLVSLAWAARRAARLPPAVLLAGRDDAGGPAVRRGGVRPLALAGACLAAATACGLAGRGADAATSVGLFFAAGSAALGGFLALAWWWLGWRSAGAARTLPRLARRGLAHRRGRAFAIAATVAVAEFLVVAVSTFRLGAPPRPGDRDSPTGGWTHVVSFGAPTALDPGAASAAAREELGLDAVQDRVLAECDVALVRSSGGVDASCTSLYDAAGRAAVLGVGPGFVARGGFRFAATARPAANPWTLLDRPAGAAGAVPAILDAATA